jgi:NADPH:quinone reductase-like Zn-dependent oxidoreductase
MTSYTGIQNVVASEGETPIPSRGEVLVKVEASSLNARDLSIVNGRFPFPGPRGRVPLSDGAGVVEAVGDGVSRFVVGDRVVNSYFPTWFGGPPRDAGDQYGTQRDGWLTEFKVVHEEALVHIPKHLSFEEAATLPCAAVTAWSAVNGIGAGDTVVVQGSGGVSLFALQLARAAGARVIATTSSDEKAASLTQLGASDVINYVATPDWGEEVRTLTDGVGVDRVVEVGGAGNIPQSIAAINHGGHIALVGQLASGRDGFDLMSFFFAGATLRSIGVGSRTDLEEMNRVIAQHDIHPVIDRAFGFDRAPEAWSYFENESRFGKVVISH